MDPSDSNVLYAASGGKNASALFISRDFGESWQEQASLPETPRRLWVDPQSPTKVRRLFIASPHFVAVKNATGVRRLPTPESLTLTDVALGFVPGAQAIVYATSEEGAFVSRDGESTWHKSLLPGTRYKVRAIATSLRQATVAYISYSNLASQGKDLAGSGEDRRRGRIMAARVERVWDSGGQRAGCVDQPTVRRRLGRESTGTCIGRAGSESVLRERFGENDEGRPMEAPLRRPRTKTKGGWTSTGLDVTNGYGIHFDPFHPQREFMTHRHRAVSQRGRRHVVAEFYRRSAGGMVNTDFFPVSDAVRNFRIKDNPVGGNTGIEETAATHILLNPNSAPDARVLYVAAFGRGVYKSTDGGKTWSLKKVYVTTFGGSVRRGFVKSQDAPLDFAAPVLQPEGSQ